MGEYDPGRPDEPVVVVFRPKPKRAHPGVDKQDLIRTVLGRRDWQQPLFFEGRQQRLGTAVSPAEPERLALDINRREAPIVCLRVTPEERQRLERHPDVILVEQDDEFAYAQDPASSRQRVEGQPTLDIETIPAGVAHIGAPEAWGNSQGKGIRVAILDSGIDSSHPDLAGNFMGGVSFVPGSPTERDDEGHGTFCAGIVGAGVTGAGIVGVAPQAFLYAVKVSDRTASPTLRSLLAGIDWCIENRMHVVNVSLGYPRPSYSLYLMCRRAWEENVLIVASAGNASERSVHYPAALDCVVGVSAIDASNERYRPSNMGVGVNLCAPGVNVLSTGLRGTYRTMSGTSAACPHVSGAAALAWGAHRFSSNRQVWSLLAQSARSVGSSARHGRVRYGLGRVNAHAASSAMTEPKEQPLWGYRLEVGLDAAGRRTAIPVEQRDPGDAR